MIKIGVTGGIGSGKSVVCRIFSVLGVPVYYADREAKRLMQEDPALAAAIRHQFGEGAYDARGLLDTRYLAARVFRDPAQLARLNALVHPATIRDADNWAGTQRTPYVLKEAALMFETESFHHVDRVLGVRAPRPLRIRRAMDRDGVNAEEVLRRMEKQLDEDMKMRLCDYLIDNDEVQALIPQVLQLHQVFLGLAGG